MYYTICVHHDDRVSTHIIFVYKDATANMENSSNMI